jgi:hypothetical protein
MATLFGFTFGALGVFAVGDAVGAGVASAANALAETPPRTRAALTAVARSALLVVLNILNLLYEGRVWKGLPVSQPAQ